MKSPQYTTTTITTIYFIFLEHGSIFVTVTAKYEIKETQFYYAKSLL
jgi:Tfp pilus assembly protein PilZ